MSARLASPSNGRMMSRTSPSIFAASATLAKPGPIAAATSAGVEPSGISFTDPSGSAILNIFVMSKRHVAMRHRPLNRRIRAGSCQSMECVAAWLPLGGLGAYSMDAHTSAPTAERDRAIRFTGSWREYLPIAATNALLIICTLGVYRFWAAARQRRYLWSRTEFIDDTLEWTGTGKEMFLGFLIVIAVLAPFFLFFQFLFPALIARGKADAAFGLSFLFEIALIYLGGFARFRALRYRLSRTYWHGIRGGSDDPGWNYGGEYLGRLALSLVTFFIVYPWAATRLWNSRWNAMSFGPLPFRANLNAEG